MASVFSHWTNTPVNISGTFSQGEWADAGTMAMPKGVILVKNDAEYLYLALDMTGDTGNTPGVGDYFWLSFDVDHTSVITPRFDVDYGIYPSLPIKMARSYYLGPGAWTGILPETQSVVQQGFAPSPNSAVAHRIWEMKIALSEVGIHTLGGTTVPYLRFGVRAASTSPSFVVDFPPDFYTDFTCLNEIFLATSPAVVYPPGTAGPIIGGVGLIPCTKISSNGRATTDPDYYPPVTNAAFGGTLNFLYNRTNMTALWAAGARKYRILHRYGNVGDFVSLRRTWSNYRWTGTTYVLEAFGPDSDNWYELKSLNEEYSTRDLLFQWNSVGSAGEAASPTGLHEFSVEFRNASGGVVKPAAPQTLSLFIDNTLPELQIYGMKYKTQVIQPCDIVQITETPDPVQIRFRAFDPEGNLLKFALQGFYGGTAMTPVDLLPSGMGVYGGGDWQGVADQQINCPTKFPPVSCAYQIRLSANPRVTNGYGYIGFTEVTSHVTFQRPGAPHFVTPKSLLAPFGFKIEPENRFVVGRSTSANGKPKKV